MNKTTLTLGSLFDGSGGFPLGGILAGIEPMPENVQESMTVSGQVCSFRQSVSSKK